MALEKEGDLNRWVDNERRIIEWLAGAPGLRADASRFSREAMPHEERLVLQLRLARAASMQGNLEELFVLAPSGGEVLASTVNEHVGKYHVADLFYTRGKSETFIQNVFTSPITGRPTLTIATPIRGSGGEVLGVLAGNLDLSYVDELIESSAGLGASAESYLVSPFNDFVSSERFGREEYRRGVFSSGIDAALEGASGIGVYENYAGVPVIGAYRWEPGA